MQDLKVTLVQANQIWENKKANFENYLKLLEKTTDSDLIILPEMFNTGFSMNASFLAEKFENSDSIEWLKQLSRNKNAAIYTSLIIEENGAYFNRGVFIDKDLVSTYDKRQTFSLAGEDKIYHSGIKPEIIHYKNWRINLQICYDLRFPELCLNTIKDQKANYDISIYVANWPEKRISHWSALLKSRAIENQAYVIGVNRIGEDENRLIYNGHSQVINSNGENLLLLTSESTQTIVLEANSLNELRKNLPFIKDRKC